MENRLPSRFNPAALGRTATDCSLELPVSHFTRFASMLMDDSGEVRANVRFEIGQDNVVVASGRIQAQVKLTCQRCLGAMAYHIETGFRFGFSDSEAAADELPEALDPVLVDEKGDVHVIDMFEDELILQLPLSTLHAEGEQCVPLQRTVESSTDAKGGQKTHQPFSDLGNMLKDRGLEN